jgi:NO-binding membrane sensor protein with MHYT domain
VTPAVVGDDVLTGASVLVVQGWSVWALPWSQLGLVLLVVAAAVAVPLVRRRRADAVQRRVDEAVAAARAAAPRGWGP